MRLQQQASPVRNLLETPLAKPWHYRRSGVYYLRVRPLGSVASCTVSLRTTDKPIAMSTSKQLQAALRAFHLDNPDATWPELREQMRGLAEDLLASHTEWDELDALGLTYSELNEDLGRVERSAALSVPQAKAVSLAREIMTAAERRLSGDTGTLVKIIERLDLNGDPDSADALSASLSVSHTPGIPSVSAPVTFRELAGRYMAEAAADLRPSTMRDVKATCDVLSEALGELDLRTHTREDLQTTKRKLLETRKPSTVNKILARMSTVLAWGVNNGVIERAFDKKLRITKGADSSREALSPEQVAELMAKAQKAESWVQWSASLGALTGARIGELHQLTKEDVRRVGAVWVIDINSRDGKALKNRYSARLVPLVDGVYGFDLEAFLRFVEAKTEGARLFDHGYGYFSQVNNSFLRTALGLEADRVQSFHSLRHSMASRLKACGVPAGIAQDILGHSSQSISYDLYGGDQRVAVEKLAEALELAFSSGRVKRDRQ